MRLLTTFLTITLSLSLVTKMSFSQAIKVDGSDKVGIGGDPGTEALKVNGDMKITQDASFSGNVGINSAADASYDFKLDGDMNITGDIVGYGSASNYGYMTLDNSSYAVNIYRGSYNDALYMDGDLFTTGEGTSLYGWYVASDQKLKRNIRYLDEDQMLSKIQTIRGRKYQVKNREELVQMHENNQIRFSVDTIDLEAERAKYGSLSDSELQQKLGYDKTITVDGKQYGIRILATDVSGRDRYGLIAQEIKDEFPELVKYDSARMQYSVNYDGFVPVLLEAVKAQQLQIDEKELQMNNNSASLSNLEGRADSIETDIDAIMTQCCKNTVENKSNTTESLKTNKVELFQSKAGSITKDTRISYVLPKSIQQATFYLYDKRGSQVRRFNINTPGKGSIALQDSSIQPGIYMYTLVANGKVLDMKRMSLTE